MSRPSIEPVTEALLPEFASFLHRHLQSARSPEGWEAGLRSQWSPAADNYGFVLRDKGEIVGGIGAYYADRVIRGRPERTCNITSWCVLDAYRQQSTRLALSVINQKGYHFTNFSPTSVVAQTLKFFKFKEIDAGVTVFLNVPTLWPSRADVLDDPQQIQSALQGEALQAWRDHAVFPWLRHVVIGRGGRWCHVVYKRHRYKGLPAASVLFVSDKALFAEHARRLSAYFLARGMASTHVETRFLKHAPWPSAVRSGFNPKLFLSESLVADDIDYLYSESVALDL